MALIHNRTAEHNACVRKLVPADFVPDKDRKQIVKLDSKYQTLLAQAAKYTMATAEQNFEAALQAHLADPTKPMPSSRDEFKKQYAELNRCAYENLNKFCAEEVRPVVLPILERAKDFCIDAASAHEQRERTACEDMKIPYDSDRHLPYSALALWTRARFIQAQIDGLKSAPTSQGSPKSILADFYN
jgi:hypothetical protein